MKQFNQATIVFLCLVLCQACKETPPYINMVPTHISTDSVSLFLPAPSAEPRHVVIGEFSGVQCKNCPEAQREAAKIEGNNMGKIHIITAHTLVLNGQFTRPFSEKDGNAFNSKYDFRTEAADKLFILTGASSTGGLPTGNVNRKMFATEGYRNIEHQKWQAYVNSELSAPAPLNIMLNAKNNGDSITIDITLLYTAYLADSNYLTLVITESGMIDYQEATDTNGKVYIDDKYEHKHILRAIVSGYDGDLLQAKLNAGEPLLQPGRIFFKRYSFKRDPSWNKTNLDIVALVHLNPAKADVLQSREAHVN